MLRRIGLLAFTLLWAVTINAQKVLTPEQTGGVYYAYKAPSNLPQKGETLLPPHPSNLPHGGGYPYLSSLEGEALEVFYISHYGRHGSRWLPDQERYDWVLSQFADRNNLTKEGLRVKRLLDKICKNAQGNAGMLTPLGAQQHRGIAQRMAQNFPTAFEGDGTSIMARSSTVPRCRASMLAFCESLQKQFPRLTIHPETEQRFMRYINYESPELKTLSKQTRRQPTISTDRFLQQFFKDITKVEQSYKLLSELHTIASDMQDIPLNINLWPYFTMEEMMAVHDANDWRMNAINGPSPLNEGIAARSSVALWENIEQEADEIIENGGHGASLRFGHDTALFRLMTLLGLTTGHDHMEDLLPMAANLQMVFAAPSGTERSEDDVYVTFLYNEQPIAIADLPSPFTLHSSPTLYRWSDLKAYIHRRIHNLEHLRQLSALNTMVGTAPANTRTAGLFGKGSEEHGQTLPAVLVPNGQTFWTPQTRDTEKKCVAPYYYTDSLLQGFRASHWLVGGCTQDYGSFTVAALTGKLRLQPEERATRFTHDQEVSHPYYYQVYLPDEHLLCELTALSHTALLRVTPLEDGPVHIVINANSDELEGTIAHDPQRHMVTASNPVHRIYQGWGERAGFSGHFVLTYSDDLHPSSLSPSPSSSPSSGLVGGIFAAASSPLSLTFDGHRGHPILLRMATSFTTPEGALRNLDLDQTFEQMMQANIDLWTARLHTIDVDDPDTARVNQFYGALYRASFLPREMSDVDGTYPRFANGQPAHQSSNSKYFGDFSMWDTYRALHPLYNIIVPETSGEMMQSLVTMYEEGGWLPIFPCWNSYTAAMIGDHCTSVLADAYVKGIRGFDAVKAYEGMRRNAFEQPATFEEYANGMGRRALDTYLRYGYIPLEDSVKEAFHTEEQTSRTLEYAYDDFCVAQMAKALGRDADYTQLMKRSENWRNVINPVTGYADGRHADGSWANNGDVTHRKPYITEGATCHYTWYVPQNIPGLIDFLGGRERFVSKLDSMFTCGRYWHGNEPCHQVPWLFALAGQPEKTRHWVRHILDTEYNDTPGGLSGNDDAGQMSAWQLFAMMGFYPVCPATTQYVLGAPTFRRVTLNLSNGNTFTIENLGGTQPFLNGQPLSSSPFTSHPSAAIIDHRQIINGGTLQMR